MTEVKTEFANFCIHCKLLKQIACIDIFSGTMSYIHQFISKHLFYRESLPSAIETTSLDFGYFPDSNMMREKPNSALDRFLKLNLFKALIFGHRF